MSTSKLSESPVRSAAVSAAICGPLIAAFCSLLLGRGQFVWNWEVPTTGCFAALVGALHGWKDAKEYRDAQAKRAARAGCNVEAAPTSSQLIDRNELHRQLVNSAQVRSVFTMLASVPAFGIGFGTLFLLALIGAPGILALPVALLLIFGLPLAVAHILTERYCKPAVACPHCEKSLWACGSGNFKPRRMRIRYDAEECPHCGARIV
jgi:hypothetical protein